MEERVGRWGRGHPGAPQVDPRPRGAEVGWGLLVGPGLPQVTGPSCSQDPLSLNGSLSFSACVLPPSAPSILSLSFPCPLCHWPPSRPPASQSQHPAAQWQQQEPDTRAGLGRDRWDVSPTQGTQAFYVSNLSSPHPYPHLICSDQPSQAPLDPFYW